MPSSGRSRVVIENVQPKIRDGYPIKRIVGDTVFVTADIFGDGYDSVFAQLLYKKDSERTFRTVPMKPTENDRWQGQFKVNEIGRYDYTIEGWIDPALITRSLRTLQVTVDRPLARFSAWYERFPRSCSQTPGQHGTFSDLERIVPDIAQMGFNVLYLPPIHPIGVRYRKGKNNALKSTADDVGSPWAVGSEEGGHTAIHPRLGKFEDLSRLVKKAAEYQMEIALDLTFHCSPDHPYITDHPEWFRWRPDGTVQYAENPPKKYEDIVPFYFESEDWESLWAELKNIVLFWIKQGIKIFRVDNPHTKPFPFWEWLIPTIKEQYPETIFLAEAFTRPKLMNRLAKLGFTQSYTYFTWRTNKNELTRYLTEMMQSECRQYFRPNFWPNTPDILPIHLQYAGREVFMTRLVLAATLSSNYGIYGPAFELCLNQPAPEGEEYIDNEKYEIRRWEDNLPGNLKAFITRINRIRNENPALQATWNLKFCDLSNDHLMAYVKRGADPKHSILVVVNLDPHQTQSGLLKMPIAELSIAPTQCYQMHDLLNDQKYSWQGESNYVSLDPQKCPAHIFRLNR